MKNLWYQSLITQQGSGAALTNTTTATSILAPQARFNLPSNFFNVGDKLRVKAGGKISTASSTPGTITFDVRIGSVVVANGGASGTLATSASNLTWDLELDLTVVTIGASTSATILGRGRLITAALSASTPIMLLPTSSPAAGTGFDSTASGYVDLFATWSVASASNSIQCTDYELISCY